MNTIEQELSSTDQAPEEVSTEEYNQIDPGTLDRFPENALPVDLFLFREKTGMLSRIYKAGAGLSKEARKEFRQYSKAGKLFFTRNQIDAYAESVSADISTALSDLNLEWEEKSTIFIKELKRCQDKLFDHPMLKELKELAEVLSAFCDHLVEQPGRMDRVVQDIHTDLSPEKRRVNASLLALAVYLERHRNTVLAETLDAVALGFFLYDIGMTKVSHLLIGKNRKLTPLELRTVREHPFKSLEIFKRLKIDDPEILEPALQHHERLNGKGYPNQLPADKIGHLGRIAGVTDTYCAMITDTPSRKRFTPLEAAAELINNDDMYDQVITRSLVRYLQTVPS